MYRRASPRIPTHQKFMYPHTVKSELNDVADPASRNKLQTMRKNAKSHGWKIDAELNRIALVQLIPDFEMLLARLIALTDAMHDPARSQDKFN